ARHRRIIKIIWNVRFGSKADICTAPAHVRFTPESRHMQCTSACPLWAKSGHGFISHRRSPKRPRRSCSGAAEESSVARGQRDLDALFGERIPHELETFVLRERDRPAVRFTLLLAGRILHVSLHQVLDRIAYRDHDPSSLRIVVHEDVVAFLRILPEVEHLRNGSHIFFGTLPTEI